MKRDRFVALLKREIPKAERRLRRWYNKPEAHEIVQDTISHMFLKKTYASKTINAAYLWQAVLWKSKEHLRRLKKEERMHVEWSEPIQNQGEPIEIEREDCERDPQECPFCHTPDALNMYGACGICHTILPSEDSRARAASRIVSPRFKVDDLSYTPHYELSLDVQRALDSLEPDERAVIQACIIGNETYQTLSAQVHVNRMKLWRCFLSAREKLEKSLKEYYVPGHAQRDRDLLVPLSIKRP